VGHRAAAKGGRVAPMPGPVVLPGAVVRRRRSASAWRAIRAEVRCAWRWWLPVLSTVPLYRLTSPSPEQAVAEHVVEIRESRVAGLHIPPGVGRLVAVRVLQPVPLRRPW